MDIVVTTPKKEMDNAAIEASEAQKQCDAQYFRRLATNPSNTMRGDRIWYVENGLLRGFCLIERIFAGRECCATTGRDWGPGYYVFMRADSWTWIEPVRFAGFQGWRYFQKREHKIKIVGGWLDPRPEPKEQTAK